MPSEIDRDSFVSALDQNREALPGLMGRAAWDDLPAAFRDGVEELRRSPDPEEQAALIFELQSELQAHPEAWRAVRDAAEVLGALREAIAAELGPHAEEFGVDPNQLDEYARSLIGTVASAEAEPSDEPADDTSRRIRVAQGGAGGATSFKLRNLVLNRAKLAELGVHSYLTGTHLPHPILFGLGLLLLIRHACEAATVHLSEQDASVFWGLIKARGADESATGADIVEQTNRERAKVDRGPLTETDVRRSLDALCKIRSVAEVEGQPDHWRIRESYKIKG
jgi:hypothetical protein